MAEDQRKQAQAQAKDLSQKLKAVEDQRFGKMLITHLLPKSFFFHLSRDNLTQIKQQLELQVRQFEEKVENLQSTVVKKESDMEALVTKLRGQIYELEMKLVTEQNNVKQLERKNAVSLLLVLPIF